jgi:hypothetical protein
VPTSQFHNVRNQEALSPSEVISLLDALAALNHLRFAVNDQQVRLVPSARILKDAP